MPLSEILRYFVYWWVWPGHCVSLKKMPSFCNDQENVPGVNINGQKVMVCLSSEGLRTQFNLSDFSSNQIMSKYVGVVINHSWSRCLGAYCSFPRSWRASLPWGLNRALTGIVLLMPKLRGFPTEFAARRCSGSEPSTLEISFVCMLNSRCSWQ